MPEEGDMRRELIAAGAGAAVMAIVGAVALIVANDDDGGTTLVTNGTSVQVVERTIEVHGRGTLEVRPDTADITVGVRVTATTASEALDRANRSASALVDAVKQAGVDDDDIATTELSVYPNYGSSNRITGYTASNTVVVTVREIDTAGDVIDAAAAAAGDDVTLGGISFYVDDTEAVIGEARRAAVENATARATAYAEAAGVEVGEVVRITEETVSTLPIYRNGYDQATGGEAGIPVQAGTQELAVDIDIVFAID